MKMPVRLPILFVLLTCALPLRGASPSEFNAAVEESSAITLEGGVEAESITFRREWLDALSKAADDAVVEVPDWPLAPGEYRHVSFQRRDPYAPGAVIAVVAEEGGAKPQPRSKLIHFAGTVAGEEWPSIALSMDPKARVVDAWIMRGASQLEVHWTSLPRRDKPSHVLAPASAFRHGSDGWSCDAQRLPFNIHPLGSLPEKKRQTLANVTSLHTISVAVETDNEFLQNKFGGNATAATNFIASLFNAMNVIYERDLRVRLVQGNTTLWTTPDPYTTTGTNTAAKLNEFTTWWSANRQNVTRGLATMFSARGTSGAAGSGWVDVLCSRDYGYSYTQVVPSGTSVTSSDILVAAHEIGHNFGADHTHCDGIDQCFNQETGPGCYTGTKSCPAPTTINGVTSVTGTLMSYCHMSGIPGCTSSQVFHPTHVQMLNAKIDSKVGVCIFPAAAAGPSIDGISPASGPSSGGTVVEIRGSGFAAGATVRFGSVAATSVTVVSSTLIRATAPAQATGTVSVTVTNPGGASASLTNAFFYSAAATGASFYTVLPCRIIDTRNPTGPYGGPVISAGVVRQIVVAGKCGIPASAKAVAANVTVVSPSNAGYLSLYPGNGVFTGTSTINFRAGVVRANNAVIPLATDASGTVNVANASGTTHLLLDVSGYFQ